jgi:hypothetical protein
MASDEEQLIEATNIDTKIAGRIKQSMVSRQRK